MDSHEAPKARRPLPTPGAHAPATRAESLRTITSGVPGSSFYASSKPPPLPSRPQTYGSSHTAYVAPSQDPPRYRTPPPDFREPELVEAIQEEEIVPGLISSGQNWNKSNDYDNSDSNWNISDKTWNSGADNWNNSTSGDWSNSVNSGGGVDFDSIEYLGPGRLEQEYIIDGRSSREEEQWWNPEERKRNQRPGPGMLAPVLAEELHNSNHSLFYVNVTWPVTSQKDPILPGILATSSTSETAPSESELRTSIPHPNAYYCPKDNGWVILCWKSSSIPPPLARSYLEGLNLPLPDPVRRRRTPSCIEEAGLPFGKANRTHHFHKYEGAVDSHKLIPPLKQDDWEILKQRRRAAVVLRDDIESINPDAVSTNEAGELASDAEEGKLLDLYVCCQCTLYCVASGVIPGVVSRRCMDELQRERKAHPSVGKSPEQTIAVTFETILTAIDNRLFKGNNRNIKVTSSGFQAKVGWNSNIKQIFELLGFVEDVANSDTTLKPPAIDSNTPQGKQNRRKLLRAWIELGSWISDFKRINARHFVEWKEYKLHVQLDSAREMYQTAIGAHPDQITRGSLSDTMTARDLDLSWKMLGLTPTTYSPELLGFAYLAQCRCDPGNTPAYLTYLTNIVKALNEEGNCPSQLQDLVLTEQSRDRFELDDVQAAATSLGFGLDNILHVDYEEDIPDDFVENAWRECVKRSWRDHQRGAETHRIANESFRVVAEYRGSIRLRTTWENEKNRSMNPDKAYDTLEIPKDVEDNMLVTVYNMRLEETPNQLDKMREAMLCIAEVRDSERLRQFITSGMDPGEIVVPTRPDLPRGLNQLGNTCYLNSLLQYFYTIKDLREAVLPMSKVNVKDEKVTDDDLKKHRVGGRLVTRREIVRSRKFINQLADLFNHLEYSENPAVTPTLELAKLALVTSRDEEEEEIDKNGTDSSNDTDATLVEDSPLRPVVETPSSSLPPDKSVLGKRGRELDGKGNEMEVDSPVTQSPVDKDGFVVVSRKDKSQGDSELEAPSPKPQIKESEEINVDIPKATPHKRTEPSDSTMMFGKQHDVAECMDNCMFQIETALLRFDEVNDSPDESSVVKRLFYGKIRQRITSVDGQQSRSSTHEKEDLFSHLPVNVANDGIDIYDGLSGYFDDVVEFQGRRARMEVTLVDLPPILQIQLQRVQFNRETLQPFKSQAYVKFGENLYMDRFMDSTSSSKKAKSKAIQTELNACRDRVRLLVEGTESPFMSALDHSRTFLRSLQAVSVPGIEDDLLQQLTEEQNRVGEEINRLRVRIDTLKNELESLWKESTEAAYELTSVFIHRGSSPSWGHYFFYSRHLPQNPDSWFKYNDSEVCVVSKDEVLADTTGSTANPYLLVFARKGSDVVDTVKRFDPAKLDGK